MRTSKYVLLFTTIILLAWSFSNQVATFYLNEGTTSLASVGYSESIAENTQENLKSRIEFYLRNNLAYSRALANCLTNQNSEIIRHYYSLVGEEITSRDCSESLQMVLEKTVKDRFDLTVANLIVLSGHVSIYNEKSVELKNIQQKVAYKREHFFLIHDKHLTHPFDDFSISKIEIMIYSETHSVLKKKLFDEFERFCGVTSLAYFNSDLICKNFFDFPIADVRRNKSKIQELNKRHLIADSFRDYFNQTLRPKFAIEYLKSVTRYPILYFIRNKNPTHEDLLSAVNKMISHSESSLARYLNGENESLFEYGAVVKAFKLELQVKNKPEQLAYIDSLEKDYAEKLAKRKSNLTHLNTILNISCIIPLFRAPRLLLNFATKQQLSSLCFLLVLPFNVHFHMELENNFNTRFVNTFSALNQMVVTQDQDFLDLLNEIQLNRYFLTGEALMVLSPIVLRSIKILKNRY